MMASSVWPEADVAQIFALLVAQGAGNGARQQFGEADDVGERRAQLVGDVLMKALLTRLAVSSASFRSISARSTRFAVGDVAIGDERSAIGERQRARSVMTRAVGPVELAL